MSASGWIGVDLDGTLARVDYGKVYDGSIGEPIQDMVEFVRLLNPRLVDFRVFTARVASPLQRWQGYDFPCEAYAIRYQRMLIEAWCLEHIGCVLPVTATKDHQCVAIIDDRAISAPHNFERLPIRAVNLIHGRLVGAGWAMDRVSDLLGGNWGYPLGGEE